MKKFIWLIFPLAALIVFLYACDIDPDDVKVVYTHNMDVADLDTIELNYRYGIYISGGEQDLQIAEHEQSMNGNLGPIIRQEGGEFSLEGLRRYSAHVLLPPAYHGSLSLVADQGTVWCDPPLDVQSLFVQSSDLLYLAHVQGPDVTVSCISGQMDIRQLNGNFDISSVNAEMKIDQLSGSGFISNVAGTITLGLSNISDTLIVETVSGDITITIPESLALYMEANTDTGILNIPGGYNAVDENGLYTYGSEPQARLTVTSISGNIRIIRE